MPDQEVLGYLREHRRSLTELLRRLALAESPSTKPESQAEVLGILSEALTELGFVARHIPGQGSGGHLYARPGRRHTPAQLLLGHCDTVWPLGTLKEMPVEIEDGVVKGPGVYD
jgi:glutamate carboxypeptidase